MITPINVERTHDTHITYMFINIENRNFIDELTSLKLDRLSQ